MAEQSPFGVVCEGFDLTIGVGNGFELTALGAFCAVGVLATLACGVGLLEQAALFVIGPCAGFAGAVGEAAHLTEGVVGELLLDALGGGDELEQSSSFFLTIKSISDSKS